MIALRVLLLASLTAAACVAPSSDSRGRPRSNGQEPLTIDQMLASPSLTGTSPSAPAWSSDGRHLAFLWNDEGRAAREVWLIDSDGGALRQLTRAPDELPGVRSFAWIPGEDALVYFRSDALWRATLGGQWEELTDTPSGAADLKVSPDGSYVSFRANGDLWLFDTETSALTQATSVAVSGVATAPVGRYNRPDVEIGPYVWGGPTYAWSLDSRSIAVHYVDRRTMGRVSFPDYLADETAPNLVRRGYPGQPNSSRTVGIVRVPEGDLDLLDLPDPTANRIVDFTWSPTGQLLLDRESDTAVDRWIDVFDPSTGERREIVHEHRETRIYTLAGSAWHPDGKGVVFSSDRADRYGLYEWREELDMPRRLTSSAFDATSGPQVARAGGTVFFQSNEPSPYERHVFRWTPGSGAPEQVTTRAGQHRAFPSPDGSRVAVLHSDDETPTELYIIDVERGTNERRITHSPPAEFAERAWARARYVTFPSRVDGATLHARILEPPRLNPRVRYPVLFGPVYSNTVRNRWGGRYGMFQQLLVSRGYIVVQVDVRGSTGYGRAFREGFLMDFAGKDLDDVESAVDYMRSQRYVDPDRFGIWGSSYGGTLTVYAMLKKPGLFQAGVAGAAAVDPHFFGTDDVAIVRRPESHPAAFLRGAAQYAENLEDPLLIIHGMQDQVVPFKTTVALAEELIRAGKNFDFAFAPGGTHGWSGPPRYARYLLGKLLEHFDRHLN